MTTAPRHDYRQGTVVRFFAGLSPVTRALALVATVVVVCPLLSDYSRFFFYLPTGARFAALLLLPRRYWPWLIAGEWLSRSIAALPYDVSAARYAMAILPQPMAGVVAVWILRYFDERPQLDSPAGMTRLVGAMLLSAALEAAAMVAMVLTDPPVSQSMAMTSFAPSVFLGDLIGLVIVAPFLLALSRANPLFAKWRAVLADLLALAGLLFALHLLQQTADSPLVRQYGRMLTAAPLVYFAFRYGWRGAALAITAVGLAFAPLYIPLATAPDVSISPQLSFVIMGIAALLLGAALDQQRSSSLALVVQNEELEHANRNLDRLGGELREAARRNLRMEEEQRRRIAAEIHDELGQSLTAVHTRVKLASDRLEAAQLGDVTTSIVDILGTMRRSVHGLMDSLRPPVLDAFGLVHALRDGPLRDMIERTGMRYGFRFPGEPALIDALREDTQIAIWRIAQEAATNAVRHARAQRFDVRLRVGIRGETAWTVLDLRDDGVGIDATRDPDRRGEGLQGMHDRLLALDGVLRTRTSADGTRLHVLLRQSV